jgi:hypothetical protein
VAFEKNISAVAPLTDLFVSYQYSSFGPGSAIMQTDHFSDENDQVWLHEDVGTSWIGLASVILAIKR